MLRPAARALVAALILAACTAGQEEPTPPPRSDLPEPGWETSEFHDPSELLRSIENGTFAERTARARREAGIEEPPLPLPAVPEPVKIAFVRGTAVPRDQMATLRTLADVLEADPTLQLDIVGCSDPSGPEATNLKISQARAESVASQLEGLGVSVERIGEVMGRGEGCEVQERAVHVLARRAAD